MIDPTRWILVETWFSLGLRVEWCPSWRADEFKATTWQPDETRAVGGVDSGGFVYAGGGVWLLRSPQRYGADPTIAPSLSTGTLKHELAHYLASTEDERRQVNFGMDDSRPVEERDPAQNEERAVGMEKAIDAMLASASRIATMALGGGR